MMKNNTKSARTLVCIGGGRSKLNLYKIIEYKIKTIDKYL